MENNITFFKCGDIFVTSRGVYLYKCSNCGQFFDEISKYEKHFLSKHFKDELCAVENNIVENDNELDISVNSIKIELYDDSWKDAASIKIEKNSDGETEEALELFNNPNFKNFPKQFSESNSSMLTFLSCSSTTESEQEEKENNIENDNISKTDNKYSSKYDKYNVELNISNKTGEHKKCSKKLKVIEAGRNSCKNSEKEDDHLFEYENNHKKLINDLSETENGSLDSNSKVLFPCEFCKFSFSNQNELLLHIKTHSDPGKCQICGKISACVQKHIKRIHSKYYNENYTKGIFPCKYCIKNFLTKSSLMRHELNHETVNNYCNICGRNFQRKCYLDSHIKLHSIGHKCKSCFESFQNKNKLFRHRLTKHTEEYKNHVCGFPPCTKIFRTSGLKRDHERSHTGERPYKCKLCPAAFALNKNLKDHVVYKHNDNYDFQCTYEDCTKVFKTNELRRRHINYMHKKERHHQCEECGLNFLTSGKLSFHKKMKHLDYKLRPHSCNYCDKKFVIVRDLKEHQQIHTGEKPFKCDKCTECFSRGKLLTKHKRLYHQ